MGQTFESGRRQLSDGVIWIRDIIFKILHIRVNAFR